MKKLGVLLLLIVALAASGLAAELYIEKAAREGYEARLSGLAIAGKAPLLGVTATIDVVNTTRFEASFERLEGVVSVQGREQEWTLEGPAPGTLFAPDQPTPVTLEVQIGPQDAVAIGLAALAGGGLDVRFDGTLSVKALGVWPVAVELHDRQTIKPGI